MSEEQPIIDIQATKEQLKNKQRIRLLFPYEKNQEIKKLGAKWDGENKIWYYPSLDGTLPEELKQYRAHVVYIEYLNKEYFKPILTSMRFDKNKETWIVNQADYQKFLNINSRDENQH